MPAAAPPKIDDPCSTFITVGFHLNDIDQVKTRVFRTTKLYANDKEEQPPIDSFTCSHCGKLHALTVDMINGALYEHPAGYDKGAMYDQLYFGIIENEKDGAAGAGIDWRNGFSSNTEVEILGIVAPEPDPEPEPLAKEVKATTKKDSA